MFDKLLADLKKFFDISVLEYDFSNIDRENPPIFGPKDIFEDWHEYDDEFNLFDIILIIILLVVSFIALTLSIGIFNDCIGQIMAAGA